MTTKFSRRTFLKTSGLVSAGIAATTMLPDKFLLWAEEQGMLKATYIPTYCEICFWKCGVSALSILNVLFCGFLLRTGGHTLFAALHEMV